jgi:hypothetical protein
MNDARRARLERLTRRWRSRHDAARTAERPKADADRELRAGAHFPYREISPSDYAARYGADMSGFTYDEYAYSDPQLDAWLVELGKLLRLRRG